MECWYIVVVLELIQYEDTPPVDAPHGPRKVRSAAISESCSAAFFTFLPADPRVRKGEVVVLLLLFFFFLKMF